jgi:hypothetical protein
MKRTDGRLIGRFDCPIIRRKGALLTEDARREHAGTIPWAIREERNCSCVGLPS